MTGGAILDFSAERLEAARAESRGYQRRAADPDHSAWVSANAGTGKTYVLVLRVLRLLLSGAAADSILCLTFTKAAAAEMSNRLIARLGDWAAMTEDALATELAQVLDRPPTPEERAHARCLFAKVLDAPGGLKIMTIHAFCDRVLRRFPLEASVPPSFTILSDEERTALLQEATNIVLHQAACEEDTPLGQALLTVVAHAGEDRFQDLLHAVIARQDRLRRLIRDVETDDPFDGIEAALRRALGTGADDTPDSLLTAQADCAPHGLLAAAIALLRMPEAKASDEKLADALSLAQGKTGAQKAEALASAFLTKDGKARADRGFVTKALTEADPGTTDALRRARDDFAALGQRRRALDTALASAALLRLADAVIGHYEDAKARRTSIDFDGLIAKTASLFQRSGASAWVLYRLDSDLRHILVDEAQDTSPSQWALVRALTAEFFAGEGVEDRTDTMFAVGDEKQSIYGFQGADPRQFAEAGREYSARARAARQPWIDAPLTLSFRTTRAVLEAVDLVFADPANTPGLTADGATVRHFANRAGQAGLVEIWDTVKPDEPDEAPAFEPFSEGSGAPPPAARLAARIAAQIRHWLDTGEHLDSLNRPVCPGDILILVRKREPFAAPMVKALKAQNIPVAGADRMKLTSQLAVMDLMALGDSLLLPEDDLTLATLLKSPIFGLDDNDLFAIGHGRNDSLWSAFEEKAARNREYAEIAAKLERWREAAVEQKPFEFYMNRLEGDGLRRRLLDRLGPDAADAIDEFLNLALGYETAETPTLQGFLHWVRVAAPEIKRDMEAERDEVRVMTVHGSKGLEANIVFLADTCSAKSGGRSSLIELDRPDAYPGSPKVPIWVLPGSRLVPAVDDACAAVQQAEHEEYLRLLYVAMTRARDRLYITGFESRRARERGCWYNLINDALEPHMSPATDFSGLPVSRMECPQEVLPPETAAETETHDEAPMPEWQRHPLQDVRSPAILAPSRVGLSAAAPAAGGMLPRSEALIRGQLTHRLLEKLPPLPVSERGQAGAAFLAAEGHMFAASERETLLERILGILAHPEFGHLFGPDSLAEAPIVAELDLPDAETPLTISGQIDRLLIRGGEITICDFKTGAGIPDCAEETPDSYLVQLAAYRLALARIEPEKAVQASLLWTDGPVLMSFSSDLIMRGERLLYESLRSRHLDCDPVAN